MRKPTKTKRQNVETAGQADNIRVEGAAAVSVSIEPRGKIGLLVSTPSSFTRSIDLPARLLTSPRSSSGWMRPGPPSSQ